MMTPRCLAVAAGLGLMATLPAHAQPVSPFYIGASQTFTRDTNVVRAPDDRAVGDLISTTSLLGGFDRYVGRQHVYFNGALRRNIYRDNDIYDNTGYSLVGGLDWSTANRISGTATVNLNRALSPIGQINSQATGDVLQVTNVASTKYVDAAARIGTVTPLTLEGTYTYQQVNYSAPQLAYAEFSQHTAGVGLLYRSSAQLTTGTAVRLTRGRYPRAANPQTGATEEDTYTGRNLDLTLNWTPSGLSTVTGRVSYNRTERDLSRREFSGVTGNVLWRWQPTGKWRLNTQLARATGEDAIFISAAAGPTGPSTRTGNYSTVADTLTVNAQYLATGKITVEGNAGLIRRKLASTVTTNANLVEDTDNTRTLGLTARYAVTRALQLSCSVGRDTRSTASAALSYAYRASYAGCTGQLTLQP